MEHAITTGVAVNTHAKSSCHLGMRTEGTLRGLLRTVYKRKTLWVFNLRAFQLTFVTHWQKILEPRRTMIIHFADCNLVRGPPCPLSLPISSGFRRRQEPLTQDRQAHLPATCRARLPAEPAPSEPMLTSFPVPRAWQVVHFLRLSFLWRRVDLNLILPLTKLAPDGYEAEEENVPAKQNTKWNLANTEQ